VSFAVDQQVVKAFAPQRSHIPLRKSVRPGRVDWRLDDPRATASEDVVEGRRELAVAVADQEAEAVGLCTQVHEQVTGLLGGPGARGVGGDAQDVHAAGLELHHEEHVQALEEHGVNVQEVARQDPGCLGGQELRPGRRSAPGCWCEPGCGQDPPDGSCADAVPEAEEFTLDAPVSPPRVLPGQSLD
jgi:hypothetical protein